MSNHRIKINIKRSPVWHTRQQISQLVDALSQLNRSNTRTAQKIKNEIERLVRMINVNALQAYQKKLANINIRMRKATSRGAVTVRRGRGA